jgi:hypothetical protein
MSARAAAIVPDALVDVFEHVPEYSGYDDRDVVKTCESDFRISLGRVIKSWGDQLLDAAEHTETPLTRAEMHAVDVLLGGIADLFDQRNRFRPVLVDDDESTRRESLARADAGIIALLEEGAQLMRDLRTPSLAHRWLEHHAAEMAERLHHLNDRLDRRNRVLLDDEAREDHTLLV